MKLRTTPTLPSSAAEGLNGAALQTEDGIGGGGRVECARCQRQRAATNLRHRTLLGGGARTGGWLLASSRVSEGGSYNAAEL